ncbi:MAG: leucine-rich repeat domain-containing protein [Metamycoplasmataceae bacterium]
MKMIKLDGRNMKSKKNNKKTLISTLSLIGLGSFLCTGIAVNNNVNPINSPLISSNNDNDFQINNLNIEKQFDGQTLTRNDIQNLGWDTKTNILLEDWENDAPNVTIISDQAFEGLSLMSIEIPNQITSIGDNAFKDTTLMSLITFRPASQLTTIGNNAFNNSRITTLNLPNSVISIGTNAFRNTTLLQGGHVEISVTLRQSSTLPLYGFTQGQWNSITWRELPFQGQTLTKSDIVRIGWENKTSITLDDWALDAPKVTRIDSLAFEDSNFASIVLPNKITDVRDNAFVNTSSLTSITLPYHLYVEAGPTIPSYGFTINQWNSIIWDDYPMVGKINKIIAKELLRKSTVITWNEISKYDEIDNEAFADTNISSIRIERKINFSIGNNAFQNTPLLDTIELSFMYKDSISNYGFSEEQIAIIKYIDEGVILTLPQIISINVIIIGSILVVAHVTLWILDWKSVKKKRLAFELGETDLMDEEYIESSKSQYKDEYYNDEYYNDEDYNDEYYNDEYYNDECYNDECYNDEYEDEENY